MVSCRVVGLGWVGLGWVGLGWVGLGWVGLGWVGLNWVGLGWVGLGWLGLGSSGDLHEVAQGGGSRVGAALAPGGGARLISRPVLLVEVGTEVGDVSAVTPDTPPPPLARVLVAKGLEFRFDLAMIVHILADLHVLGGGFPMGPGVAVLPVPLQPPHEAADDGQAGHPGRVLWAGHGAWWWLWLLVRKMQRVVIDELLGVGVLVVSSPAPSGTLGLGTSAAVERF